MNESSSFEILDPSYDGDPNTRFRYYEGLYYFNRREEGSVGCSSSCSICAAARSIFNAEVAKRFSEYSYSEWTAVTRFTFDGERYEFCSQDDCKWDVGADCAASRRLFQVLTSGGFDPAATASSSDDVTSSPDEGDDCTYPDCACDDDTAFECGYDEAIDNFVADAPIPPLAQQLQEALQRIAELEEEAAINQLLRTLSVKALELGRDEMESAQQTEAELRGQLTELSDEIANLRRALEREKNDVQFYVGEYKQARDRLYTAEDSIRNLRQEIDRYENLHTDLLFAAVTGERKTNGMPF